MRHVKADIERYSQRQDMLGRTQIIDDCRQQLRVQNWRPNRCR